MGGVQKAINLAGFCSWSRSLFRVENSSDTGLVECTLKQRRMKGAVGVLSFLQSFVLGTFNSINFSLAFCNKAFNEAVLEL